MAVLVARLQVSHSNHVDNEWIETGQFCVGSFIMTAAVQLCIDASTGILPTPDWRRSPGRPRPTWLKQVDEELVLTVSAAWITAMDRQ